MRAIVAALVMLLAIDSATAACHRFHIWKYPWAQRCRVTALAPRSAMRLPQRRILISIKEVPPQPVATPPRNDIPIPNLADIDWGHLADDEQRARILLRVILQGKEDK